MCYDTSSIGVFQEEICAASKLSTRRLPVGADAEISPDLQEAFRSLGAIRGILGTTA